MPFNNEKSGVQNEYDFIKKINGKKIKQLNILFQMFIYDLYGKIDNYNNTVYAWKKEILCSNKMVQFMWWYNWKYEL